MRRLSWLAALPLLLLGACAQEQPPPPMDNPGMPPGLAPTAAGASAQTTAGGYPAQFSCPANGTIVETTNGVRRYFGAAPNDPELCVMQRPEDQGQVRRVYSLFTYNPYDTGQVRAALRQFFPLYPGKSVRHSILVPGSQTILTFTAVGRESVTVPAGTFDTWVIDIAEQGVGFGNDFAASRRTWLDATRWFSVKETYQIERERWAVPTVPDWQATRVYQAPAQ
ncbi:MAG: hypothetical protein IT556_09330 [Acetobacteraceae bacterium]|nr:hypothetical protein [Acetobacteraceae bacterium]